MNILITIPKSVLWQDYQKELDAAEEGCILNYRVSRMPRNLHIGDKCYVLHNGFIRGYHYVTGIERREGFLCLTSGAFWTAGCYVQRTGAFHKIEPIPCSGFRGFQYYSPPEGH